MDPLRPESSFQMAVNWSKIWKKIITSQFADNFWRFCVSPVKFRYWFKFFVNIMTCSEVMTLFIYKGLTRNPEVKNTPVCVLHNVWKLGLVRRIKFGTYLSSKRLLNAAKCQGYSFYRFYFIKGKPTGSKITPIHTHKLALKNQISKN